MHNENQRMISESEIMTVKDVAEYLRMSEAKVYRLANDGLLPGARIGKTWRFRKDLLDHWLEERSKNADPLPSNERKKNPS